MEVVVVGWAPLQPANASAAVKAPGTAIFVKIRN